MCHLSVLYQIKRPRLTESEAFGSSKSFLRLNNETQPMVCLMNLLTRQCRRVNNSERQWRRTEELTADG